MRAVNHGRSIARDEKQSLWTFDDLPRTEWLNLFSRIATGDEAALNRIFELSARTLYGLALWRTASVEDARDVVQDVFVRVAEHRRDLPAVRDPRSWLLAVTRRLAIDLTRRRKVRRTSSLEEIALLSVDSDGAERSMDQSLATRLLLELPPNQRDAIYLHLFADLTFAAVGDVVGVPTFTAASRYRRGIRKLRRLMEGAT
jgi:RNA polymerase sigma-70 factor, ECF subfamily